MQNVWIAWWTTKTLCLVGYDLQNVQGNQAIIPIRLMFIRHESDFMHFLSDPFIALIQLNLWVNSGFSTRLDFDQSGLHASGWSSNVWIHNKFLKSNHQWHFWSTFIEVSHNITGYTVHSDKRKQTGEYKKVSSKPSNSDSKFYRAYNFESLLRSFVFCRLFQFKSFSCPLSLLVLLVLKSCTCELS